MIKLLNSQGKTIIISSHDVEFIADLKPRIILMKRGKVIADGNAEEIFLNEELLKSCNLLPPQLITLSRELEFIGVRPRLYSPRELAAEIMTRLRR